MDLIRTEENSLVGKVVRKCGGLQKKPSNVCNYKFTGAPTLCTALSPGNLLSAKRTKILPKESLHCSSMRSKGDQTSELTVNARILEHLSPAWDSPVGVQWRQPGK